ncbi:MAG: hypothetical protein JXN65_02580 [Clostridia bacterium]|nr:hypothetical protein [Clostridia bacterium]
MKVILSRKGIDTQYGGMPSPILPDGTLLSLPIPSKEDTNKYSELRFGDKDLYTIIKEISPNNKIKGNFTCHLDPDIRNYNLINKWQPLFGQQGAALGHLLNQGVDKGDLFLFFGTFRQTVLKQNTLSFITDAADKHIIFGYFQINNFTLDSDGFPIEYCNHPHSNGNYSKKNAIYSATEVLTFNPLFKGAGTFKLEDRLVLTKEGYSKSCWELPEFFKDINISYHSHQSHKVDYFQSASKGQEFVFEANENVMEWLNEILIAGIR